MAANDDLDITYADVERAVNRPDSATPGRLAKELWAACDAADGDEVTRLVEAGADVRFQDPDTGLSALMVAARAGATPLVTELLAHGAPWNAQDRRDQSAGDHAISKSHMKTAQYLLNWACLAEDVLRAPDAAEQLADESKGYLQQKLTFEGDKLVDSNGEAVMMSWEEPVMLAHANLICQNGGDILNVGFGMGIIDRAIQEYKPKSHTIIEAHPDVYAHMLSEGWDKLPNVRILFGRWQDVADQLESYDGIFFDTYAEHYEHMAGFHALLGRILKKDGLYSYFNGLAPRCEFFHLVYNQIVSADLAALGMAAQFLELPMDAAQGPDWDAKWKGVKNRYWFQRVYRLPIVHWKDEEEGEQEVQAEGGE